MKARNHSFAVLIPARNEEVVIGELIKSLKQQKYPKGKVRIFVVADNCVDSTAKEARKNGAIVFERKSNHIGKGYALDFLIRRVWQQYGRDSFDAFAVFDADNLVDKNFIAEINKVHSLGYDIVTSYRNSKNFADNMLTATSSIFCLYQSRAHRRLMRCHKSCTVSGTGFVFSNKVARRYDGWPFYSLGEDIEFSITATSDGYKIGYSDDAILYDEQARTLRQFIRQRVRWVRGNLQARRLSRNRKPKMAFPAPDILSIATVLFGIGIIGAIIYAVTLNFVYAGILSLFPYLLISSIGLSTVCSERKRIMATGAQKLVYATLFPVMIFLFIVAFVVALISKNNDWKPVLHNDKKSINEIGSL